MYAQNLGKVIQLYGLVSAEDSISRIYGAHVYNPHSKRGTTTDIVGYFSMPVRTGDTLRVSHVGYEPYVFRVPKEIEGFEYVSFIQLRVDTVLMEEIRLQPFISERAFKEAVLARKDFTYNALYSRVYRFPTNDYFYTLQQSRIEQERLYGVNYAPLTDLIFKPLWKALRRKRNKRK